MARPPHQLVYNNAGEEGFTRLRKLRRFRLASSTVVLIAGLITVTLLAGPLTFSSLDYPRFILWLVAVGFFLLLLVGGLLIETRRGIEIIVTEEGVIRQGRLLVAANELKGAKQEVRYGSIVVKAKSSGSPLFSVELQDLANPLKFREAVEQLTREL